MLDQLKPAIAQSHPDIQAAVGDAQAAGVSWLDIVKAILAHAGDVSAIIQKIEELINNVRPTPPTPAP